MITRFLAVVALCIFIQSLSASNAHAEEFRLVARMEGDFDSHNCRADILEASQMQSSAWKGRQVHIACNSDRMRPLTLRETVFDAPVSIFRLYDGASQIITLWASGSAYHLRIYNVQPDRIVKVLDAGTKSAPQFIYDTDGKPSVVLQNDDAAVAPGTVPVHGVIWTWNGARYQLAGNKKP